MELFSAVGSARAVANFVEGGPLTNALADLGIDAARSALSKTQYAIDKRAPVQSAITHLEGVESVLGRTLERYGLVLQGLRWNRYYYLLYKRRYALALMALCYRYLGEEELCKRTCAAIENAEREFRWWEAPLTVISLPLLPLHGVDEKWHESGLKKYEYDHATFVKCLNASWE